MDLFAVLLTGLFAGGLSCAAVQGGLLAGLVTRQRGAQPPVPAPAGSGNRRRKPPAAQPTGPLDDLAPVGGFLAGKLVSHTLLGAALGALGQVAELSLHVRAMAQLAAGVLIVIFGLAQLGVPGFRGLVIEPPASWARRVRGRTRSTSVLAPAVLGLATVLIPCGVTLSVMALAVTTGSPLGGAATMAVFVVGTAPLFTLLGYAARRAVRATGPARRALAVGTGLLVVALGLYTFNGGLEVTGSPLAASQIARAAGLGPAPVEPAPAVNVSGSAPGAVTGPVSMMDGRQVVVVTARTGEYTPENIEVRARVATTLVVRAERAQGCVREFVLPMQRRSWRLPVNGDTRIELGPLNPGVVRYSCAMGMYTGQLTVVDRPA